MALGTDGAGSNNSLDLLDDVKAFALLQKHVAADPAAVTAAEAWEIATGRRSELIGEPTPEPGARPISRSCAWTPRGWRSASSTPAWSTRPTPPRLRRPSSAAGSSTARASSATRGDRAKARERAARPVR